ncbi:MAG: RIP metalloprotease RseP [Alphaproteobacteria bacterium]|nr:RIP metalloprotease RseP [Alphaproteobacteria bacterium]
MTNIFEYIGILGGNIWLYGGSFLLILSLLVFIHEWGHYIVARLCGVRIEIFSIGFGKELFGFQDRHGTRWKLSLIPLGGYVKMFGDVDPASAKKDDRIEDTETGTIRRMTPEERDVAFFAKPVWKRALIVFAGPAINYLFAIVVMTILFVFNGQPVTPPTAAALVGGSSAEIHGFQPHDIVLSIDGKPVTNFEDIRQDMSISLDRERQFVVQRGEEIVHIQARPEKVVEEDRFGFKHSRGLLGLISPSHAVDVKSIRAIEGKEYGENDLDAVNADLRARLDSTFAIEVDAGGKRDKLLIHPLRALNDNFANAESKEQGILYIAPTKDRVFLRYGVGIAFVKSLEQTWYVTRGTLEAMSQMVAGTRSASELGGVIRIGALAGDMAQKGLVALILFTALLSINLGLINLFPIPLLDGGHLVFYAAEAILRRPIPDRLQEMAFQAGLVVLVTLMVFTNLNDIIQLIL